MPIVDRHNLQLGGEGMIRHSAFGLVMDHAFACLVEDCADLQWAWVLAILPHLLSLCNGAPAKYTARALVGRRACLPPRHASIGSGPPCDTSIISISSTSVSSTLFGTTNPVCSLAAMHTVYCIASVGCTTSY